MTETIKFNNELLKLLCVDDTGNNDNTCLITNIALEADHIELVCNHKFNYVAIFREISKQKEITKLESTCLKPNQVKCPYCRTIQTGLIPSNESYSHLKQKGVNIPERLVYKGKKCTTIIKSGKRKGELCDKDCVKTTCKMHSKTNTSSVLIICEGIIKTGKRKGIPCGARCIKDINKVSKKCSRHINFKI